VSIKLSKMWPKNSTTLFQQMIEQIMI